jgi:hypothetical protein
MLMHSVKEAPPCFVGSWRHRRSPDEGLGERARKKLLGHKDGEREPKVSHPPRSRGRRVSAPHWGSTRWCANVID